MSRTGIPRRCRIISKLTPDTNRYVLACDWVAASGPTRRSVIVCYGNIPPVHNTHPRCLLGSNQQIRRWTVAEELLGL